MRTCACVASGLLTTRTERPWSGAAGPYGSPAGAPSADFQPANAFSSEATSAVGFTSPTTTSVERSGVTKPWWNFTTSSRVHALTLDSQPMGGCPSALPFQNQRVIELAAITEGSLLSDAIWPSASSFFLWKS